MNVLVACPSFRVGGWTSHALNLGSALRRFGHRTTLVVTDPFGTLYDDLVRAFDRVVVVRRGAEGRNSFLRRLVRLLRDEAPDALVNNSVPFVQAALPYLPAHCVKVAVIHSPLDGELTLGTANGDSLDLVVAVAPNIREKAARLIDPLKVRVIPPGVVIPVSVARACDGRPGIRAVYVGRVTREAKNLGVLEAITRRAVEEQVQFDLTVIGDGDHLRQMKRNAASGGYGRAIRFLGFLSPDAIRERLSDFDALILTSTYEGAPHAVIEAMAHGVVPIVSRIEGASDFLVEDGATGFLCDPSSPEDFLRTIKSLVSDPSLVRRIAVAARQSAMARFSIDRVCLEYATHISSLAAAKASHPAGIVAIDRCAVTPALERHCAGMGRHLRRMGGDLSRAIFRGVRAAE